jgi:hypoxanthine-DNA glycosylase
MFVTSFPPIIGENPRVLLLGSMPGGESLRQGRYYAHPHNLFWPFMGELIGAGPGLPYDQRVERVKAAGIALWDVLKHCEREGSLDSSIRVETEIPNELAEFLEEHSNIRLVGFNGKKAAGTFERRVFPEISDVVQARVRFVTLPSTSPANAGKTRPQKLAEWRATLEPFLQLI